MWSGITCSVAMGMLACVVFPGISSSTVPRVADTTNSSLDYGGWRPITSVAPIPVTFAPNATAPSEETRRSFVLVYPAKPKESYRSASAPDEEAIEHKPSGFRPPQNGRQLSPPLRAYPTQINYHRLRNAGISPTFLKSDTTEHPKYVNYRPPAVVYERSPATAKSKRRPADAALRLPSQQEATHHQIQIQLLDGFLVPPAQGIQHYGDKQSGGRPSHVRTIPITLNDVPQIKLLLPGDVHEQLTKLQQQSGIRAHPEQREKSHAHKQQQQPAYPALQNPIPQRNQANKIAHQAGIMNETPRQNTPKENYRNSEQGNIHQTVRFPSQEIIHHPQQYQHDNAKPQRNFYATHVQNNEPPNYNGNNVNPRKLNSNPFRPIQSNSHRRPEGGFSEPDPREYPQKPSNSVSFPPTNQNREIVQQHSQTSNYGEEIQQQKTDSYPPDRHVNQEQYTTVSQPGSQQVAKTQQSFQSFENSVRYNNQAQFNSHTFNGQTGHHANSQSSTAFQQQHNAGNLHQEKQSRIPFQQQQHEAGNLHQEKQSHIPFQQQQHEVGNLHQEKQSHIPFQQQQPHEVGNLHQEKQSHIPFQQQQQQHEVGNLHQEKQSHIPFQQQQQHEAGNLHQEKQSHISSQQQQHEAGNLHQEKQSHIPFNQQQEQGTEFFPDPQQITSGPKAFDFSTPLDNEGQIQQKPASDESQAQGDSIQQKVEQGKEFDIPEDARRFAPQPTFDSGFSTDDSYSNQENVEPVPPESGQFVENGEGEICHCHRSCAPIYYPSTTSPGNTLREIASRVDAEALFEFINIPDDEIETLLASTGSYTLFLPSNEAVSRLPQNLLEQWRQNDQDFSLALLNHVVAGTVRLDDLKLGGRMESRVPGSTLFINNYNKEAVTVNGHRIVRGDIPSVRESLIHVVDGMLCPVGDQDIIETLKSCNKYDGFLTLADVTKLMDKLREEGPYTVFLPSNEALTKIPTEELNVLKENVTALRSFLEYHIVQGVYFSADLKDGQHLTTLFERKPLRVGVRVDGCHRRLMEANNSPLCKADIPAKNGVIHIADWSLRPSDLEWCDGVILP